MGLQNMQQQNNHHSMHFVLSTDSKPRLKWTPELHQRFIDATNQLGGAEKATPKSLMRVLGIPGLTLYHLKSHLQKYRLGKSQHLETLSDIKREETKSSDGHCSREISLGSQNEINENLQIAQALQMQMEAERKRHEQIESNVADAAQIVVAEIKNTLSVQKHLQLRIEAQGNYLESVLNKAQEALAGYNSSPVGIQLTKAELSQLVTMINNTCPSSPVSELTETRGLSLNCGDSKQDRGTMCSLESSLTSSESSGRKEEKNPMEEIVEFNNSNTIIPLELPLMTMHQEDKATNGESSSEANGRKRNLEHDTSMKICVNKLKKTKMPEMFDLTSQCKNDMDSTSSKILDLNCSLNFWEP